MRQLHSGNSFQRFGAAGVDQTREIVLRKARGSKDCRLCFSSSSLARVYDRYRV
jgi:hypothetical protein